MEDRPRTLIIAEIGQNHNGDMAAARELIDQAKSNGADIAKFQLYDVDSIFTPDFEWYREGKEAQLTRDQAASLAEHCKRVGIEFMASVFDLERLAWCEELGVRRHKIASRSIHDRPLIEAAARTGKEMIVSLGFWKSEQFPVIKSSAAVRFLYCVAKYPTAPSEVHLERVDFNKYAGFSDHTAQLDAAKVAIARGARIIEKHFTLDKAAHGPDHRCSMTPPELAELTAFARRCETILYD